LAQVFGPGGEQYMAKFVFRAEVALTMRRKREDEAKIALAAAQRFAQMAEEELRQAQAREIEAQRRACEAEAQATDPVLAIWYRNWIKKQQRDVARGAQVLDGRRAEVKGAEQRAMEARRAVRALEKLRERKHDDYVTQERQAEQKEIDLLGVMQYAIRHRGEGT
jgi:flagellar export protein FliJ